MKDTSNIVKLVALNANIQLAHWKADSLGNSHKTLGDLYESMVALTDDLAENLLGKNGNRDITVSNIVLEDAEPGEILEEGFSLLADIRSGLTVGEDDDALNILADISAAMNKAKYLLRL